MAMKKVGLALGSGAARGWAHIGVLEALEENNISVDYIAGASIGSFVGGNLRGGWTGQSEGFCAADGLEICT